MILPWKQVRWATPLPIEDCAERLMAAPGAVPGSPRTSSASLVVMRIGRTFTLSVAGRLRWLPSRPYLFAVMIERPDGTMIVGRFNPDALVIAAGMCAIVVFAVPVAAVLTVGVSGLSKMSSYWFGTVNGLTSSALAVAALAMGVIRSRGWHRQCRTISSIVENACCATPIDRSGR